MNLYFPVYNRLEDEVIALFNEVFFDDKQLTLKGFKESEEGKRFCESLEKT